MRALLLVTDIYTRGGIARYTSALATALGHSLGAENADVLALLDWGTRENAPAGFRVVGLVSDRVGPFSKLEFAVRALRQAGRKYDLVIANHVGLAPVAALVRRCYGTPYWVACHGTEVWRRLPRLSDPPCRERFVLPVSQYTAERLAKVNGIASGKMRVLYNAIPVNFSNLLLSAAPGAPSAGNSHEPFLLSVGGVSKAHEYKGVGMVIQAMPRILAAVPAAHYVVVGEGNNRRELERLAEREGVARHVEFVGAIPDPHLATLYRNCDLLVMPSRVSECAGLVDG